MCFNLNLLECKYIAIQAFTALKEVLISTYWNVNVNIPNGVTDCSRVLISTYWNVNVVIPNSITNCSRFNLNLLECKCSI